MDERLMCDICDSYEADVSEDSQITMCERCAGLPKSVSFLLRKGDEFLAVSRRHDHTQFGLPGGKVDPGESLIEAIKRELQEETGLIILGKPTLVWAGICVGQVTYTNCTFSGGTTGILHTEEPIKIAWVPRETLENGPFGDYNRRLFRYMYGEEKAVV